MKAPRTRVVSLRVPIAEFVELASEAEANNQSVSEALLTGWRYWKSLRPIEERLEQIEAVLTEARAENDHKFQQLAEGLNQLILGHK